DQSASGATLFIEPMPVVELNNDLRNFQLAEKREIEAILTGLTKIIAGCISELEDNLQSLARLDFIFAKGKLSQAMDGCQPELNTEGLVHIKKGRHPLLVGEVVPIDIHLGRDFRVLVITGPNTGGKTVALKTVGLLCLMAQCGMHIPAEPGTELAVFQSIFADIGDEQSIEQSLSTFSGHMTNIVQIMNKIKLPSLVLLDELGAGTDPVEGSALAIAILKKLRSLQAHTIATTHYSELKAFAYNTPGVENASVEFDPVTLRPTYRLLIGMPGRSNAFEIAARLGLAPEVVAEARSLISRDELEIGHLLKDLEAKRKSLDRDREEVDKIREELAALRHNLEAEKRRLHEKEEKIIAEAYRRSESIIKKGQQEISSLIKMLKEQMEKIDRKEQEKSIQQAREQLKELKKTARQQLRSLQPSDPGRIPRKIKPGDLVFVTKLQKQGRIIGVSGGQGPVQVQIGILKVEVPWEDLREIDEPKTVIESNSINAGIMVQKSEEISPEIDLRGCTVEEALEELSKFFDDVLLSNLTTVYLIHGKGTGALRTAIGEYLRDHPRVKNFRLGYQNEGGSGVTVVEFKD
ncbi:MAG: endonuclease MutS2, partial [Clostridia bacterium]|nr:endonuclease MutS2 [Clostridia bacterium]